MGDLALVSLKPLFSMQQLKKAPPKEQESAVEVLHCAARQYLDDTKHGLQLRKRSGAVVRHWAKEVVIEPDQGLFDEVHVFLQEIKQMHTNITGALILHVKLYHAPDYVRLSTLAATNVSSS